MKKKITLIPKQKKILEEVGENIRLARLRRKLSAEQVSDRANISRRTLWAIENGTASVSMGAYLQVLFVLGLENDLIKIARDDEPGRKLQDLELIVRKRAPKRSKSPNSR